MACRPDYRLWLGRSLCHSSSRLVGSLRKVTQPPLLLGPHCIPCTCASPWCWPRAMRQWTYDNGGSETNSDGTGRSGHVWVIAIHWHVAQAQLRLGPYATMQQALHPLLRCFILEHTPAVIWERFTTLTGSLRAQDVFRLTPDVMGMSNPRLLALYPAKEWQGSALAP